MGPIIGGIILDMYGFSTPFLVSIFVELCLIPFYLLAVFIIKPHLREKFEEKLTILTDISSI